MAWFQGAIYLYNIFIYIVYKRYHLVIPLIVSCKLLNLFFATRGLSEGFPQNLPEKRIFVANAGAGYQVIIELQTEPVEV